MFTSDDENYENAVNEGLWPMDIDYGTPRFVENLRCRPASCHAEASVRERLINGGKMFLPQSCLETLSRMNVTYPLQFRVELEASKGGSSQGKFTHLGVLEFSAPEGVAFLPDWVLKTLGASDRDIIQVTNVSLPIGRFVKFQPQSVDFLEDLSDPRSVLEHSLRNYAAMTVGDVLVFEYNGKCYGLLVQEVKPDDGRRAILVVETDLQVDFSPPVGYVETVRPPKSLASSLGKSPPSFQSAKSFAAFSGTGNRLKNPATSASADASSGDPKPLKLPSGLLFLGSKVPEKKKQQEDPVLFAGKGRSLK